MGINAPEVEAVAAKAGRQLPNAAQRVALTATELMLTRESVARSQDFVRIPIVREITEPTGEGQSTLFALP
jgi:hypothetical protein